MLCLEMLQMDAFVDAALDGISRGIICRSISVVQANGPVKKQRTQFRISSVSCIKGWFKAAAGWLRRLVIDCRGERECKVATVGYGQAVVSDVTGWPNWPVTGGTCRRDLVRLMCNCSSKVRDGTSVGQTASRNPSWSTLAARCDKKSFLFNRLQTLD